VHTPVHECCSCPLTWGFVVRGRTADVARSCPRHHRNHRSGPTFSRWGLLLPEPTLPDPLPAPLDAASLRVVASRGKTRLTWILNFPLIVGFAAKG
jgi:hypothetical protein